MIEGLTRGITMGDLGIYLMDYGVYWGYWGYWGYRGYRGEGERIEGEIGSFYMFLLTILGMMEISGSALWIFYLLGSDIFEVSHGEE